MKKEKKKEDKEVSLEETIFQKAFNFFKKMSKKQVVYDTKRNTSLSSQNYGEYSRENIIKWLKSPDKNENNLRKASNYLYLTSMHYQRLIKYYANLLCWNYVISPTQTDINEFINNDKKKLSFEKQYRKVAKYLELLNIKYVMTKIMPTLLIDGVYYGVKIIEGNNCSVHKINPDICKVTSVVNDVCQYSVDMSKITEDKLCFYPEIFTNLMEKYKITKQKYQEIPLENSFCLKTDLLDFRYSIPPFAAVMPSLYKIANNEDLQEAGDELNNYKMLAGEVPVDKNGTPLMGYSLFEQYYDHIANAIGDRVGLAISPFKLNEFNFEKSGALAEVDTVSRAVNNYWATAGTSGLLHGVSNSTSGVTKLAIKNDESYVFDILNQVEHLINNMLATEIQGSIKFKINILPITIYNKDEYIKMYKESVAFGIGKSYYISSLGIPQYDVNGLCYLEDEILNYKKNLTPLLNSHNSSASDINNQGRNKLSDDELSDSGEQTRDNDSNDNR